MNEINELMNKIINEQQTITRRTERIIRTIKDKAEKEISEARSELLLLKSKMLKDEINDNIIDFKSWIKVKGHKLYDDTIESDLCHDIMRDESFIKSKEYEELFTYIYNKFGDDNDVLYSFMLIYKDYLEYKKTMRNEKI